MTPLVATSAMTRRAAASSCFERNAGTRRGVDAEAGRIERRAPVPGAGIGRDALFDHERAIEPAGRAAAEHLRQHFERLAFAGLAVRSDGTR